MARPPDCDAFYSYAATILKWGDLSGKVCLDVGCGNGSNSTYKFIQMFPKVAKLIAIDKDMDILEMPEEHVQQFGPKVEFCYGRIDVRSSLRQWENKMQVIVSHYCFNCVQDQRTAFQNLYRLLEDGGSAALIFTVWANFYDWSKDLGEEYAKYAMNFLSEPPQSHTRNYYAADYTDMLTEIGFEILRCDNEQQWEIFESDDHGKKWLGSICPITDNVPIAEKDSFLDHIFNMFLRHNPRDSDGMASLKHRAVKFLLRKPRSNK